jgi:ribose/xylose/arabinose/galactoside ABC-type transport system permease subunit
MTVSKGKGTGKKSKKSIGMILLKARTFIALIVLVIVFAVIEEKFLCIQNILSVSKHVARYAVLAIGMTFVIISGEIDLSVGSVAGLSGMVVGGLVVNGISFPAQGVTVYLNIWIVILIGVIVGAVVGFINGILVGRFKVPAFIATLGMMYVARGVALLINQGSTFSNLAGTPAFGNTGLPWLGAGKVFGIPVIIIFMVIVGLVGSYILKKTPKGWHIYAVGGNENAAKLSGVKVPNIKLYVFVFSSICAAFVGIFAASSLEAAHPATGETWEMNAIASAVLGGTSMAGGLGTIGGTIVGAFVIGVLNDGMIMMGLSSFWQQVIKGAVIIFAVIIDQIQRDMQRRMALQSRE